MCADFANDCAGTIHEQRTTLHNATAQGNLIWGKEGNEIGQSQTDVIAFPLHALESERVTSTCIRANFRGVGELLLWLLIVHP